MLKSALKNKFLAKGYLNKKNNTHVIYNLCQLIINLTVVNAAWKEVWYNAVKRNYTITYFLTCPPCFLFFYKAMKYSLLRFFCATFVALRQLALMVCSYPYSRIPKFPNLF
jgi:hypothetical protein